MIKILPKLQNKEKPYNGNSKDTTSNPCTQATFTASGGTKTN